MFGNLWFSHLSRRTTVIHDLLVRRQFSLVSDKRYCRGLATFNNLSVHTYIMALALFFSR
jgi:hypothetical protein